MSQPEVSPFYSIFDCIHVDTCVDCFDWVKVEQQLRSEAFGYRARFIQRAAAEIGERGGLEWFEKVQNMSYKDAHAELIKLTGIGPKVTASNRIKNWRYIFTQFREFIQLFYTKLKNTHTHTHNHRWPIAYAWCHWIIWRRYQSIRMFWKLPSTTIYRSYATRSRCHRSCTTKSAMHSARYMAQWLAGLKQVNKIV